jgi:hypothetical protein
MEQRPLRLGDIVDDYCPRERRVTNHAVVAIVGDAIRQTRCTTCDAEHVYKSAKPPRRRKKDGTSELYDEVLASVAGSQLVAPSPTDASAAPDAETPLTASSESVGPTAPGQNGTPADPSDPAPSDADRADDGWPANRPLIRATLPRTENDQPTPRPIPEFTMHQRNVRGGQAFRHGQPWQDRGNGNGRNGFRPARFGPGQGRGHGQPGRGPGPGQGQGRPDQGGRHQGKKRSR